MAHSMSCGPPKVARARAARRASGRSTFRLRSAAGVSSLASRKRPRGESASCAPSTSPDTNRSGPPGTAATTRRSERPVTGSAPKSTPPHAGCKNGWTSAAIGAPCPERATVVDRVEECRPTPHVEHRREHAGHRLRRAVLVGRRRPNDERPFPVLGELGATCRGRRTSLRPTCRGPRGRARPRS